MNAQVARNKRISAILFLVDSARLSSVRVVIFATVMRVPELSDGGSVDMGNFFLDIVVIAVVWDVFCVICVVRHCFGVAPVGSGWLGLVVSGSVVV